MFPLRLLAVVLLTSAIAQRAGASAFADFNQGLQARNRDDIDAEIAAFSRALTGGDLLDSLKSVALYDRGVAYQRKENYADAVADFSAVIKQKPDYREAYARRAESNLALGQYDAAAQDCEQLTLLKPNSASPWASCGRIAFITGQFEHASSDFRHALQFGEGDRNGPYDLLWLGLTGLRMGKTASSEMGGAIQSVERDAWPSPLIEFFLGQIGEQAVKRAASEDAATPKVRQCEVGFYLGEWKMAYHDSAAAKSLFREAASLCPDAFTELGPAKAELAKLQQSDKP